MPQARPAGVLYFMNNLNDVFIARSILGRILVGCYWVCILIWVSTYTANLAAFFTIKSDENPIKNLEDLAKSSYQVGLIDSTSSVEAFKSSQYETDQKIWRRVTEQNTIVKDTNEGYKMVREKEEFAFISDGPTLQLLASQPPCDLTTGKLYIVYVHIMFY